MSTYISTLARGRTERTQATYCTHSSECKVRGRTESHRQTQNPRRRCAPESGTPAYGHTLPKATVLSLAHGRSVEVYQASNASCRQAQVQRLPRQFAIVGCAREVSLREEKNKKSYYDGSIQEGASTMYHPNAINDNNSNVPSEM